MRVLFIVPYYKPAYIYGGPIVVIALLAEQLVTLGHDVTVYTTASNGKTELDIDKNTEILVDGVKVYYFDRITGDNTYISTKLWSHLNKTVEDFDAIHIHTWWNFLVLGAALICKKKKIKPVISPHGMLSDYIMYKRNPLAKKWVHNILGRKLLENSWLHVSTEMEWGESRKVITTWEGKIIPNLVKLSDKQYPRVQNQIFTIGFLSRVDPKKGLDVLIKALSGVNFEYKLLVAGSGEAQYVEELKNLAAQCGNADKIDWVGWKGGESKFEYLSQLDLMALTSHSENFAIVIIESLSVGTPVFISDQVGLFKYIGESNYGWVTDMKIEHITKNLNQLFLDKEKFERINTEAPAKITEEYEESHLANEYIKLYKTATTN